MSILWFVDGVFQGEEPPQKLETQPQYDSDGMNTAGDRICISAVMTTNLLTAENGDSCEEALEALEEEDFHHLPVTDDRGVLVGVVSDRDLLRNLDKTVGQVMTTRVLTAIPETELQQAALAMTEQRIHSLVVIDEDHVPRGILTSYDILTYLVKHPRYELWSQ